MKEAMARVTGDDPGAQVRELNATVSKTAARPSPEIGRSTEVTSFPRIPRSIHNLAQPHAVGIRSVPGVSASLEGQTGEETGKLAKTVS